MLETRGCRFGVKFRPGFNRKLPHMQEGCDRWAYNRLLELLKAEYARQGYVNCTRGRINAWYTEMRREYPFLRQTASQPSRMTLHDLGRHYTQFVETERLKAAGEKPQWEFGEPHFKRYSDPISIPFTITHDNTCGSARLYGRELHLGKFGGMWLSHPFPVLNYSPKRGTIHQTRDGKWRIGIVYGVEIDRTPPPEPVPVGIDRNIGNNATPEMVVELPPKVVDRMNKLERSIKRSKRTMSRRQGPNHKAKKSGSNRYEKARVRHARQNRKLADMRDNAAHKAANVIGGNATHAIVENLRIGGMVKSAKGTVEEPGTNVAQKSGLNGSILSQFWGKLFMILAYSMVGGVIKVDPAYTSQTCSWCLHIDAANRLGRLFRCVKCGFIHHADINAVCNIENRGRRILGMVSRHIISLSPAEPGLAQGMGCLDAEGGDSVGHLARRVVHPVNRQTWTEIGDVASRGVNIVRLWDDV